MLPNSLHLHQLIRNAQSHCGIKHQDYERYRRWCTTKLSSLRKINPSLFGCANRGGKFTTKFPLAVGNDSSVCSNASIDAEHITVVANSSRFMLVACEILLWQSQRCWADSMNLSVNIKKFPFNSGNCRRATRLKNKLKKSLKYTRDLVRLAEKMVEESSLNRKNDKFQVLVDAILLAECKAYLGWLTGFYVQQTFSFATIATTGSGSRWQDSLVELQRCRLEYERLICIAREFPLLTGADSLEIFEKIVREEIEVLQRFSLYNLRKDGVQSADIASATDQSGPANSQIQTNLASEAADLFAGGHFNGPTIIFSGICLGSTGGSGSEADEYRQSICALDKIIQAITQKKPADDASYKQVIDQLESLIGIAARENTKCPHSSSNGASGWLRLADVCLLLKCLVKVSKYLTGHSSRIPSLVCGKLLREIERTQKLGVANEFSEKWLLGYAAAYLQAVDCLSDARSLSNTNGGKETTRHTSIDEDALSLRYSCCCKGLKILDELDTIMMKNGRNAGLDSLSLFNELHDGKDLREKLTAEINLVKRKSASTPLNESLDKMSIASKSCQIDAPSLEAVGCKPIFFDLALNHISYSVESSQDEDEEIQSIAGANSTSSAGGLMNSLLKGILRK